MIFSQPVTELADINLYGRVSGDRQCLVVALRYTAEAETALVLPLPVRKGCGAHEVRTLSMDHCGSFFASLAMGFTSGPTANRRGTSDEEEDAPKTVRFTRASVKKSVYVPTITDFADVDWQWKLPTTTLAAHPQYGSFGFMLHVLPAGTNVRVGPVALDFPTRDPSRIFFPTLQSRGGPVPQSVMQDCVLYCQDTPRQGLDETPDPASKTMVVAPPEAILNVHHVVQRQALYGSTENRDTWIEI